MTNVDILGKLFGSPAKVKIMRLFLFNAEIPHDVEDISKKVKVPKPTVRKDIASLEKIGFIKKRVFYKKVSAKGGSTSGGGRRKKVLKNKKTQGFILNQDFYFLSALQNLLVKIPAFTHKNLEDRFKGVGALKLLIISGVFLQEWDSSLDILVVGDRLNTTLVDRAVTSIEAEVGRELTYAVFDTTEFEYRVNVYDKLIRNILDYNHQKIVNKLGI